jgi:hypothetical protein
VLSLMETIMLETTVEVHSRDGEVRRFTTVFDKREDAHIQMHELFKALETSDMPDDAKVEVFTTTLKSSLDFFSRQ